MICVDAETLNIKWKAKKITVELSSASQWNIGILECWNDGFKGI